MSRPPRRVAITVVSGAKTAAVAAAAFRVVAAGLRITRSAGRPAATWPVQCSKPRAQAALTVIILRASVGATRPAAISVPASWRIERSGFDPRPSVPRQIRMPARWKAWTGGSRPANPWVVRGQNATARRFRCRCRRAKARGSDGRWVPWTIRPRSARASSEIQSAVEARRGGLAGQTPRDSKSVRKGPVCERRNWSSSADSARCIARGMHGLARLVAGVLCCRCRAAATAQRPRGHWVE